MVLVLSCDITRQCTGKVEGTSKKDLKNSYISKVTAVRNDRDKNDAVGKSAQSGMKLS